MSAQNGDEQPKKPPKPGIAVLGKPSEDQQRHNAEANGGTNGRDESILALFIRRGVNGTFDFAKAWITPDNLTAAAAVIGIWFTWAQYRASTAASIESDKVVTQALNKAERIARSSEAAVKAAQDATALAEKRFRDETRLEQRAWIGFDMISPEPVINEGTPPIVMVTFKNTGRTPAMNVRAATDYQIIPSDRTLRPRITTKFVGNTTLPPGSSVGYPNVTSSPLDAATVANLKAGRFRLHVFGRIEYLDVFGDKHVTTFCLTMLTEKKQFLHCPIGNSAN